MSLHRSFRWMNGCLKQFECSRMNINRNLWIPEPHLSFNVVRHHKMFVQAENKYAYEMLASKGYLTPSRLEVHPTSLSDDLFVYLKQDWTQKSPQELCGIFGMLAKHCKENSVCISNRIFDDFIDAFTDNIKNLSDEELKQTFLHLKLLPETPSVKTRNFIEIWAALDDACITRYKTWPADTKLLFATLTFELNIARACDYTQKCVQKLTSHAKNLTVSQILQTSFLMGVIRSSPLDKHNFELYLEKNVHEFTAEDVSILAMGFFKSRSPIRSAKIMNIIIDKIIAEKESLDDVPLAALFKLVRYSYRVTGDQKIISLLNELEGEINRLSIMACVHFALVGASRQLQHASSLSRIVDRVARDISSARLKDLERLVLVLVTVDFRPTNVDFVNLVLEELRRPERQQEIASYGKTFSTCVMYATSQDYFPYDLIDKILDPKFIEKAYGEVLVHLGRELLVLDNTVEINCPDYTGNRLSHKQNKYLAKSFTDYVPTEDYAKAYNVAEKLVLEIVSHLTTILEDRKYICGDHAVPHYQRGDIFMCFDKNDNPVDLSPHFPIKPFGHVKRAPTDDKWVAIVIAARNALISGTDKLTGPFIAKSRDLKKLGYRPVIISCFQWEKMKSEEEKIKFLRNLIKEAIKT